MEEEHRRRTFVVRKQKNCRPTNGKSLDNISASLQTHNLLRTTGNLNKSMVSKELSQPQRVQPRKAQAQMASMENSAKHVKTLTHICLRLFQNKIKEEGISPNPFGEAGIALIPKLEKNTRKDLQWRDTGGPHLES